MTNIERKIKLQIHRFDLVSLLQLLHFHGYRPEEIQFTSNSSITSQSSLIHDIEFSDKPLREVNIILNYGLLSAQSPLPSYFIRKVESDLIDQNSFSNFLQYFDHVIIKNFVQNIYPEANQQFDADWELTKRHYLQILNLKSPSSLDWLFTTIFPDLELKSEKEIINRRLSTGSLQLGSVKLGDNAVFGSKTHVNVCGVRITLFSEGETTRNGEPWPRVIKQRLDELIFPLLSSVGIDIGVFLVIRTQKTWVKLHQESYLGYDKIRGGEAGFRRIRIFKGHIVE